MVMDRRGFIRSVAVAGAGAALAVSHRVACAEAEVAATTKRFSQQRWALDNIIRANGIDWDQPRSIYLSAPCGVEANADFAAIRARVQKMADIGPAFESTAKRREAKARAAEADGNPVTARTLGTGPRFTTAPPSGPTTTPDHSTSSFTTRSGNAFRTMRGSPTTRSKRFPFHSRPNRFRAGFICRPAIAAARCRW
jgi:hypothetical protein